MQAAGQFCEFLLNEAILATSWGFTQLAWFYKSLYMFGSGRQILVRRSWWQLSSKLRWPRHTIGKAFSSHMDSTELLKS